MVIRRLLVVVCVATLWMTTTGCTVIAPFRPPMGAFYSNTQAPLDVDFERTLAADLKRGDATSYNVLGLFTWGNCSTHAAAAQGGLSHIDYADYSFWTLLGIYSKVTVHVYGD